MIIVLHSTEVHTGYTLVHGWMITLESSILSHKAQTPLTANDQHPVKLPTTACYMDRHIADTFRPYLMAFLEVWNPKLYL
jgi:hypothetical protein